MKAFLAGAVIVLTSFVCPLIAAPQPLAQGLSGNYKLAYIASDLATLYRSDENRQPKVESFNFKKVGTPPVPAPIYMLHDPKGPSATLLGGGSDNPRLCEGENDLLSQKLECAPLSKETWIDEKTKCGIKKLFVEGITWNIKDNLQYSRTEAIIFDKETPAECETFKKNLLEELGADKGPDFFKAMKEAELFKNEKDFADVFLLTHVYQANETDEKAIDLPEGNQTGAYELEYSGKSKTVTWNGEDKKDLMESELFKASDYSLQVERLDNILFFHDPKARSVKIGGAGQNKIRKCELISKQNDEHETYSCTLFKAKEEEVGTGCTIEHQLKEEITLIPNALPHYERIEQRQLLPSSKESCDAYRQKIYDEIKEGSAELFFRVLSKSVNIQSAADLGDTFQLVHEYTLKLN